MAINWPAMFQIGLSALLGGMIGLERESRGRDAGFRTNVLIAMGSCLFTILSITAFPKEAPPKIQPASQRKLIAILWQPAPTISK